METKILIEFIIGDADLKARFPEIQGKIVMYDYSVKDGILRLLVERETSIKPIKKTVKTSEKPPIIEKKVNNEIETLFKEV